MQRMSSGGSSFRKREHHLSSRSVTRSAMMASMGLVVLLGLTGQVWAIASGADSDSGASAEFDKKSLFDNSKIDSPSALRTLSAPSKFIPADQAFKLAGEVKDGKLILDFQVTPGYYLYQHKFAVTPESNSVVKVQELIYGRPAQIKDDPEFGKVPVYHDDITVTVPYSSGGKVTVRWQGCADAGLCYPPQTREFTLPMRSASTATSSVPLGSVVPPNSALSSTVQGSNVPSAISAAKGAAEPLKQNPQIPMLNGRPDTVSYTHLTLPTNREV